ncbi:DUF6210 family protein [Deinococcus peraridilitoris]|uniref:DUF6210 family protein n=1 Tax=Deinococcus peraridilitoris TaxID=432329 RepID=UPI001FE0AD29|nr:DUF6210 family protein [Deinococcus peraridilitoris]
MGVGATREDAALPATCGSLPLLRNDALKRFFTRYRGNPPCVSSTYGRWEEADLTELAGIIQRIPLWRTSRAVDELGYLLLDRSRLAELTEGWVPVVTVYGPAILTHQNCD